MPQTIEAVLSLYEALMHAASREELAQAFDTGIAPMYPGVVVMLKERLCPEDDSWWDQISAVVTDFFGGKGLIPSLMLFENYRGELPASDYCVPLCMRGELYGFLSFPPMEGEFTADETRLFERFAFFLATRLDHLRLQSRGDELMPFLLASQQKAIMGELLRQRNEDLEEASAQIEANYQELLANKQQLVQTEKLYSLGRFTAGIAHELNTPLSAILNSTSTLSDLIEEYRASAGDPEVSTEDHLAIADDLAKALGIIRAAAEKSSKLVRTLKNNTRETGEKRRFSVREEIEGTILLLQPQLNRAGCKLDVKWPSEECFLDGDSSKLGQVVTNLVVNAIDAYEGTKGEVSLEVTRKDGMVELVVADRGSGISPENLTRIFDPLFTTKEIGKGTGLGLMIVQGIITGHFGGTIGVDSVLGSGTSFTIRVPSTP